MSNTVNELNRIVVYNETSYSDLQKMLDEAYTETSFWGEHRVYIFHQEGYVSLKDLIIKIQNLVEANPHFSEEERTIGQNIFEKVQRLCDIGFEQSQHANWITYIVLKILQFFTPDYGDWVDDNLQQFELYTQQQFEIEFGYTPVVGDENYRNCILVQQGKIDYWRKPQQKKDTL